MAVLLTLPPYGFSSAQAGLLGLSAIVGILCASTIGQHTRLHGFARNNTFYTFPFSEFLGSFIMIPLDVERSRLRFGYYSTNTETAAVTESCMKRMNEDLGPEDIALNLSVQKGPHSLGYDQGRYMIDAQRSNESEHLVHHFHRLVFNVIHVPSAI